MSSQNADTQSIKKFAMGGLCMTRGVSDRCAVDLNFCKFVTNSLRRHSVGDWGDLCAEDKEENNYSLDKHLRILSAYKSGSDKIWIITEADRSATTILFPEEY